MNKQLQLAGLLYAALFISVYDGSDGADGFNSLIVVRNIPVGDAVCLSGGRALDNGLDTTRNDILDPCEVTATEYLECAETPTLRALHALPDARRPTSG